jgi:hypothetical protein
LGQSEIPLPPGKRRAAGKRPADTPAHGWYAHSLDDRDPIFRFTSDLTVFGTAFAPKQRAGHSYEVTIYGDDSPSSRVNALLKN